MGRWEEEKRGEKAKYKSSLHLIASIITVLKKISPVSDSIWAKSASITKSEFGGIRE